MGTLLTRATLRGTLAQVHHVTPVHPRDADGLVARVYRQCQRDFGMLAPPMSLHSPAPPVLAAAWLILRETLLVNGFATRAGKEAVAATVSVGNACPYCVEVHGSTMRGLVRTRYAVAVSEGRPESVTDPALRAVAAWARDGATRAGARPAPVPAASAAELTGVAVTFQYLNRMVNVFLDDSPLPPTVPAALRGAVRQATGWVTARASGRVREPGAALALLPAAPLPIELSWATGHPRVAGAFARAAAAFDTAAGRSVPGAVRELVHARLSTWDGEPVDRTGVDEAVSGLDPADQPAGRLALLTALASYRVGPSVVAAYRRTGAGDADLVGLTAWASFTAARRVGSWLRTPRTRVR
jgi:AhpD family alkylhydroperoxidase